MPLRILAFLLGLGLLWLPFAIPIALWSADPNQTTIVVMLLLFVEFVMLMRWWGRQVYGDRQIFHTYGLTRYPQNWREAGYGLGLGLTSVLLMFAIQGSLGWVIWQTPGLSLMRIGLEGLLVAIGVGLAEELVFRGWILHELQRDYLFKTALWIDSLLFAVLHFLKPLPEVIRTLPQFPALVLLGLILCSMKRSTRRRSNQHHSEGCLGLSIGFHAGLVWGYYLLNVGEFVISTNRVPTWITGIDGNPLAGAIGLIFLLGWALYWRRQSNRQ